MPLEELSIGDEVKIYDRHKRGYGLRIAGTICDIKPGFILVEKGYKERFDIIDFRRHRYRLFKVNGIEVKFPPLPDKVAIDDAARRKAHEDYLNSPAGKGDRAYQEKLKNGTVIEWKKVKQLLDSGKTPEEIVEELNTTTWIVKGLMTRYKYKKREDEEKMAIMTKEAVRKMADTGMDMDSIAKEFETSYPNAKQSVIKAKVAMLLSGKSTHPEKTKKERGKKNPQPESGAEEYITKHDAAAENLPVPEPIPEVQMEQKLIKEVSAPEQKNDSISFNDEKIEHQKKHNGLAINKEFEKAIQEMEEENQVRKEREAIIKKKNAEEIEEMEKRQLRRKPLLKPKCLVGELTGHEYLFIDDGISLCINGALSWDELDNVIEELQAVRDMKSA